MIRIYRMRGTLNAIVLGSFENGSEVGKNQQPAESRVIPVARLPLGIIRLAQCPAFEAKFQ